MAEDTDAIPADFNKRVRQVAWWKNPKTLTRSGLIRNLARRTMPKEVLTQEDTPSVAERKDLLGRAFIVLHV